MSEGDAKGESKDGLDWKERYRSDPTTKAVVDAILDKHPEINGNPWLAADILKGFVQGTEALQQQMEVLQQAFLPTAKASEGFTRLASVVHDEVTVELSEAQVRQFASSALPKAEPVTPDRMLAALARQPALLLAVKALMMDVRVAGPWVSFNDSEWAKMNKISFPKGTMCRFTPDQGNKAKVEPVIKVHKRTKPWMPNRHRLDEEWEWEAQVKEHHAEVAEWEIKPYGWRVVSLFHGLFPMEGREGIAVDTETAQRDADEVLRSAGWVLVTP